MESIYSLSKNEFVKKYSEYKPFFYSVLQNYLKKGTLSFDAMNTLPLSLRERLTKDYKTPLLSNVIKRVNDSTGSIKLLLSLYDGLNIECVLLENEEQKYTACLSTEVGCSMKCEFCATGTLGLKRQLDYTEIIEEYFRLYHLNEQIDRIVFMGMGEPLCNFENVVKAIEYFKNTLGLSGRRITISTSGIAPNIKKLADLKLDVKLALSLVTADDNLRSKLMKTNRLYPLSSVKKALEYYYSKNKRRISLEYCLLKGVNTDKKNAELLKEFCNNFMSSVNLIPWNAIKTLPFETPSLKEIEAFEGFLTKLNITHSRRKRKGEKTSAACGMLVASS